MGITGWLITGFEAVMELSLRVRTDPEDCAALQDTIVPMAFGMWQRQSMQW